METRKKSVPQMAQKKQEHMDRMKERLGNYQAAVKKALEGKKDE